MGHKWTHHNMRVPGWDRTTMTASPQTGFYNTQWEETCTLVLSTYCFCVVILNYDHLLAQICFDALSQFNNMKVLRIAYLFVHIINYNNIFIFVYMYTDWHTADHSQETFGYHLDHFIKFQQALKHSTSHTFYDSRIWKKKKAFTNAAS